uniref:Uncharacterized protein n=1 Tax=viral metagenome TaxID=1070528 RepID=A0A6C0D2N4_9ZZZZ
MNLSEKKILPFIILYLVDTLLFLCILFLFRYGSQHNIIGWIRVSVFFYLVWIGYTIVTFPMKSSELSEMSIVSRHHVRLLTFYSFVLLMYFILFHRKIKNSTKYKLMVLSNVLTNILQNKEEPNEECMEIILSCLYNWKKNGKDDQQKVLYKQSLTLLSIMLQKKDRVTNKLMTKLMTTNFSKIVSIITEILQTISNNNQEFMEYYQTYQEEGIQLLVNILCDLVLRSGHLMKADIELLRLSYMMFIIPTTPADVLLDIFHLQCLILVSDMFKKKQELYPKTHVQYTKAYTYCLLDGVHKIINIIVYNDEIPKHRDLIQYVRTYVHLCFQFLEHFATNQFDLLSTETEEFNGKTISVGFFIYKSLWYNSYFIQYYQLQNIEERIIKILKKNKVVDSQILKFQSKKNKTRKDQRHDYQHYQHRQEELFEMQQ